MKMHTTSLIALGALGVASIASAQATSTRRIPISKEPVAPVSRVDTITMYRTDTVTNYVHDTVTVTRVDTVTTSAGTVAMPTPLMLRQIGGFYIGVDGGAAVPSGDALRTAQSTGWHVDVPLGWDPVGSPIGVRVAAGYSRFGTKDAFSAFDFTPQVWQGDADLKLRLPMSSAFSHRFSIYGLGGATYNRFKGLTQFNTTTGTFVNGNGSLVTTTTGLPVAVDDSWHDAWGWNAGGGVAFGFGRTNLFVESRYIHFNHNDGDLNQVPIVVGLSWF